MVRCRRCSNIVARKVRPGFKYAYVKDVYVCRLCGLEQLFKQ